MAEGVVGTIAEKMLTNLVPQALEKVGKSWGVKHELEVLRDTLSTIQPRLHNAEKPYDQRPDVQLWVLAMKDALYDAEDMLEEFNIEALRRELRGHNEISKELRTFFSRSNQLAFELKMTYKVRGVRERIEAVEATRGFDLIEHPMDLREEIQWRERETRSFIREGDIKGRDDDKEEIIKSLLNSNVEENVSILPIVGIGGLGKTALVQCVYNDAKVHKHFHLRTWVRVPVDFDVNKIVKNIIAYAKKENTTEVETEQLEGKLRETIDGKRYLLVLDDVQNQEHEKWSHLKKLLEGGARGSKILITTRLSSVAMITGTTKTHFLKGLSDKASLDLLLLMACQTEEEIQDPEVQAIGREIVKKCFGVPLVIRTVGRLLLFKKTKSEWLQVKNDVFLGIFESKDRTFESEDRIRSVLKLSYDHLPSHLKQCFAFCSLFPKDYEIKKQTLINLWVAEGFIQPSNSNQHLEDLANQYFMDLLWRSFLDVSSFMNKETCMMHDLMHDLACSVAGSECRVEWNRTEPIPKGTRHISHGLLMGKLLISPLKASPLRTFLSTPTYCEMEQREPTSEANLLQLIQSFKRLRILDIHAAIVKKVPRSICKLKHLTYLDLSHNNALKRLPNSITRLQNLQTLNLQGCSALEELPRSIRKLVSLRNLDIDYCYSLSYVPRGLGQLRSLHRLTRFILPRGKALTKNYCGLEELFELNDLYGSLSIENLGRSRDLLAESTTANLMEKHPLESLILKWGYLDTDDAAISDIDEVLLNRLRPHSDLKKLTIDAYEGKSFPTWMSDSLMTFLPNLVEIRLLRCRRCKHLPQLGQLPCLKSLEIWRLNELQYIESDDSSTSTTSFPSLLSLEIRYCENLKVMPLIPHLKDLILWEVNQDLINRIIGLNELTSLDISRMGFLKGFPKECLQSLTSLERLGISECPQLTSFSHGMQHLSNLVHLSFSNCEELDLSKDESDNNLDLQGLESLQSVELLGVPKLASLPQWLLRVSNLRHLSIKKCLNLKALPEQIEALQSLEELEIIRCPLLTSLPEGIRKLTSLNLLKIGGCPELEERCKENAGEDWNKIKYIRRVIHKLEYFERNL